MKNTRKKFVWLLVLIVVLSLAQLSQSQNFGSSHPENPDIGSLMNVINSRINNLTTKILASSFVTKDTAFCIKNPKDEWNRAFNFSSDYSFVIRCAQKLGDFSGRVCTAAEVKYYFGNSGRAGFLGPNLNCNLTSWVSGCEPGWASSLAPDEPIDIQELNNIPARTLDSRPCCEGFFCPRGITCMIPCPLGAYCPLATLNEQTGVCEPYNYQLPPANLTHTCGGANTWADVDSSSKVFCQAGSYCPSTVQNLTCHKGHYCQMGSTSVKPCYKLTSCDPKNQSIRAYGIILIVGLSAVLLIIYNFSDQVLSIRERRHAKTRERAAKVVKEKVQARARWKSAKDAAKRNAMALQSQLSDTFSRNRSVSNIEESSMLQKNTADSDGDKVVSLHGNNLTVNMVSEQTNNMEPMEGSHDIEESSDSYHSFCFEVEQKTANKKVPKKRHMHSQAQIFNYAYSQLEKEKALQQQHDNLTFSRVINLATNNETRKRPTIEVSFKDLTVTLKGKNKNLLRCVTGKLMPGHITAVMGPSGAGKTTFLSALAGKTVGCTMTGHVLINGKNDPISLYKKIIGFVPQDDIVHGNLTVEENLWFSARCRLSANLPKEDKVLIVERTIVSLGLQAVRDSLVGTVEKRGISGGQRKRVNVGLEMVMEPSLLILDEPTSGLDSSSSQLLLRALRHEALTGVNICMVLHQPSYSLFKMFDDLILLAKGGLTAYHGPVTTVEEYFAGLGIIVPDRVNPPDHFIDFLEGMVKASSSSVVSYKELPLRWMLHKNYPVPADMQQDGVGNGLSSEGSGDHITTRGSVDTETGDQSFAGEVWQDMVRYFQVKRDVIHQNFLRSHDQSNRRTPGFLHQYKYFLGRIGKQRLRDSNVQAIDYLILLLAGACLGSINKVNENFGVRDYTYTIIAVSLLCKIASLRTFSLDKLEYWRERSSGISSLAHFLAKDTIDHFNTVIKPLVYLSMFYFFSNPRSTFLDNYIILLSLVYCVTGIGYVLVIYLQPGPSQLAAVLLPVVLTLISTQIGGSKLMKDISYMCYPRWALEAFIVSNAERYYGVWLITRCGALMKMGYNVQRWGLCIAILMLTGFGSRVVAFLGMAMIGKK